MNKEYEAIRSKVVADALHDVETHINAGTVIDAVRAAVESCYALANKPVKKLTWDEKYDLWVSCYGGKFSRDDFRCESGSEVVDKIIAAYQAKQREPEVVKFRAARSKVDGKPHVFASDANLELTIWEWLDDNGKPQIYEVKLP